MNTAELVRPGRTRGRAPWRVVLAVAATLAAARGGGANQGGGTIVEPAAGCTVRAGQLVRVRWTPVDPGVNEFELLLSVDGGRTFPLRLTAMLDPRLTSYSWRVPNLPSGAARLRLRAGEGGEEAVLPPGPAFGIAAAAGEPAARVTYRHGEWWPTEGVASEAHAVATAPGRMEGSDGEPGAVPAGAVGPQHPDLGACQAMTAAGRHWTAARSLRPPGPARRGLCAMSFPKRE